jgi:MFS transporter, ACS family, hexuronate transporter
MGREIVGRMSPSLPSGRSASWKWWICGLLLLASAINYMDRQTLANAATRITTEFALKQKQYGNLELAFGWAFAVGSIVFGVLADKFPVRWLYPVVLFLWSAAGFATGMVESYGGLLVCRMFLGLFEAGHWPCAVKVTQQLLNPKDRSMGNSVLQSGTSIGAIMTPQIMKALMTDEVSTWRSPFMVVGAAGLLWIVAWFCLVKRDDLLVSAPLPAAGNAASSSPPFWHLIFSRRMLVVLFVIAMINTGWQIVRAWLPKFMIEGRGYSENQALDFNSVFYIATDIGCIGAGVLTLWLCRKKFSVVGSRKLTFFICAVLSALTVIVPLLPKGLPLLLVLLLVGAGALGVFPIYHAFTQDISPQHQGKVTGVAGVAAWAVGPPLQTAYGALIDRTGSFDLGFAIAGCLPLAAFVVLWWFWKEEKAIA